MKTTTTLWRPVGPSELAKIEASNWKAFPARLPEQPIFYPVCNEEYATLITRQWNVRSSGIGHVVKFDVDAAYLKQFPVQLVGKAICEELWIPAERLDEFNKHIFGAIVLAASYTTQSDDE